MPLTLPPDSIINASVATVTRVTRRVDIYQSDRTTPWKTNVAFTDGSVNVSHERSERRTLSLTLFDEDGTLKPNPDGLWYDKIVKVYRGIQAGAVFWERKLGEFMVDTLDRPHFPHTVALTGRDFTKKLLLAKFSTATQFPSNEPIEEVIRAIAISGGIPAGQIDFPLTGESTVQEFYFDRETERWKAMHDIAIAHGWEVFFRWDGMLTMEPFQDPYTMVPEYTFKTGTPDGNLLSFNKRTNDSRLFNHVVVTGENKSGGSVIPIRGEKIITTGPTRTSKIGKRSWFYDSAFITNQAQADWTALRFVKRLGLEQFDVSMQALVIPWLEEGIVVEFLDPAPSAGDPTKFLLSEFTIPLTLTPMDATIRRIINIT